MRSSSGAPDNDPYFFFFGFFCSFFIEVPLDICVSFSVVRSSAREVADDGWYTMKTTHASMAGQAR